MREVLVFRHAEHESLGGLAEILASRGLPFRYVELWQLRRAEEVPALADPAGFVLLGGPMSVNDGGKYPWLGPEIERIRDALARKIPILGICLGSQLLAKAL